MEKIYVVEGTTGEYSDSMDWPVMAYRDEEAAKAHVVRATERAKEIEVSRADRYNVPEGANEHDPHMLMDYTGTHYNYYAVELK